MSGPRTDGQAFQSCPSATGEAEGQRTPCAVFPDGAHRCGRERDVHPATGYHVCVCGQGWVCLMGPTVTAKEQEE